MEKFAYKIEDLLQEKLLHYTELTDILQKERSFIKGMDLDALWDASKRKKEICGTIEQLRVNILYLLDQEKIVHNLDIESFRLSHLIDLLPGPGRMKSGLKKIRAAIDAKKDELHRLASENQAYVQDYLSVIDDVISTVVEPPGHDRYSGSGTVYSGAETKRLIRAEV